MNLSIIEEPAEDQPIRIEGDDGQPLRQQFRQRDLIDNQSPEGRPAARWDPRTNPGGDHGDDLKIISQQY